MMSTGIDFSEEIAAKPVENYAYWLNGRPTVEGGSAVGLHLPWGNPQVDTMADELGWSSSTVIHKDGAQKPYWKASPASLIVIASNLQKGQELKQSTLRKGVVYAWSPQFDEKTRQVKLNESGQPANASIVKLRFLVGEFVKFGYLEPFVLTGRGWITNSFLETLAATYTLTDALSRMRRRRREEAKVFFYSVSLPITAATRPVNVGGQALIYPMRPYLPTQLSEEFVEGQTTPGEVVEFIQEQLLQPTIAWSSQETQTLVMGGRTLPPQISPPAAVLVTEVEEEESPSHTFAGREEDGGVLLDSLFADDMPEEHSSVQAALLLLKEKFLQFSPGLSRNRAWFETVLFRTYKGLWTDISQVREKDITDVEPLERAYERALRARPSKTVSSEQETT